MLRESTSLSLNLNYNKAHICSSTKKMQKKNGNLENKRNQRVMRTNKHIKTSKIWKEKKERKKKKKAEKLKIKALL